MQNNTTLLQMIEKDRREERIGMLQHLQKIKNKTKKKKHLHDKVLIPLDWPVIYSDKGSANHEKMCKLIFSCKINDLFNLVFL